MTRLWVGFRSVARCGVVESACGCNVHFVREICSIKLIDHPYILVVSFELCDVCLPNGLWTCHMPCVWFESCCLCAIILRWK